MNKDKAIELLENLLSTINIFKEETEEAIEYAIKNLKTNENHIIEIDPNEISIVIDYLKSFSINPTYPRITKFLLGNKLKEEGISSHSLYGKYMGKYRRGELTDFVVSIIKEKKSKYWKIKQLQYSSLDRRSILFRR